MNARDTRIRVFLTRLKLRIVYAFLPLLFITIILLFLHCLRKQKNKLRDCGQVENLHTVCGFDYCQFRSANAADESIHSALFRTLIPFTCNKGLERPAKLNQQIMTRKTEDIIFSVFAVTRYLQSFHDDFLLTHAKSNNSL